MYCLIPRLDTPCMQAGRGECECWLVDEDGVLQAGVQSPGLACALFGQNIMQGQGCEASVGVEICRSGSVREASQNCEGRGEGACRGARLPSSRRRQLLS